MPAGATAWNGKPDEELNVTLNQEGACIHACDPHKVMAMAGVIQVGKPVKLVDAQKQAETFSRGFVMSKGRLSKYMAQVR